MNNFRKSVIKTTVFFVLFSCLAAYYYFIEVKHEAVKAQQESQKDKILQYDFTDCTSVLITRPDATVKMSKAATGWTVATDKFNSLADGTKIEEVAGGLFGLVPSRILMDRADADALAEFGLTKDKGTGISFSFGKDKEASCLFGDENSLGTSVYMQISDDARVFLVPKIVRESLMYPPEHFRERRIIHFTADDVSGLKIIHGKATVALSNNEKRWNFDPADEDPHVKADKDKVLGLLSELSAYMAEGFIDAPNKEELESLETAPLTIELTMKDGKQKTVILGNTIKGKDVNRFIKTDEVDYLLKVNADYMEKFAKTRDFFVSRKIIEFDPWEIGKAELKTDSDKVATLTRQDFKWITEEGRQVNLSEFLWALMECRYKSIPDKAPETLESKASLVLHYKEGPAMPEIGFLTMAGKETSAAPTWFISYNDRLFEVAPEIGTKLGALTDELRGE